VLPSKKTLLTTFALAAGFFLLGAANGLGWLSKDSSADVSYIVRWEAVNNGAGFAVSVLLFLIYAGIEKRLKGIWLVLAAAVLCYGSGMLWRYLTGVSMLHLGMNPKFQADFGLLFIRGGLVDGTTLGLVSFLYFGIEHWRQANEQKESARQATALAHQAQLQMLRYQLNPHFLFNALNSIRGMIVEDPARSREMVTELSEFLRYSLDDKGQESAIGDEIQAIESYLVIQRIRFEEQLDATVEAEASALDVVVPCFLIHPLVENAVKYGMKTSALPLRVRVQVTRQDGEIGIRVSNTGRLVDPSAANGSDAPADGAGIGIKNITERLRLVFPSRHSFRIWEDDGWVRAEIRLRTEDV
jgi:two-component system LytT family sensor kinase